MTNSHAAVGPGADELTPLLPGTTNTRAIPEYRTLDGRRVRPGALYRGDVLGSAGSVADCVWTPDNEHSYRSLGLRLVIDLRSDAEVALVPSAWATGTGAQLVRAPIPEGVEGSATDFMSSLLRGEISRFTPEDLGVWYQDVYVRRADVFGYAVSLLSKTTNYPALVHCHAGKDRTGLLIAVVLETLGVPRELVVADYAVTQIHRSGLAERNLPLIAKLGLHVDDVRTFWESPRRAIESALEYLDAEFGGAESYLRSACGVTAEQVENLRSSLLIEEPQ